mgnify:CR=1 FL=1
MFPAAAGILMILSMLAWQQCSYWKNSTELWTHALRATTDNAKAHNNLGRALRAEGKITEAINHYNRAIRIAPNNAVIYFNRATAFSMLGQRELAIEDFNEAIRLKPSFAAAYENRAMTHLHLGNKAPGCHDLRKACEMEMCRPLEMAIRNRQCR